MNSKTTKRFVCKSCNADFITLAFWENQKSFVTYCRFCTKTIKLSKKQPQLALKYEDIIKPKAKENLSTHTKEGYQKSDKAVHVSKEEGVYFVKGDLSLLKTQKSSVLLPAGIITIGETKG